MFHQLPTSWFVQCRYIHTTALYYWPNTTGMTHLKVAYRVTVAKPEGSGPFERSGHKAENNIKNGLGKIMWECAGEWRNLSEDRWWGVVNMGVNFHGILLLFEWLLGSKGGPVQRDQFISPCSRIDVTRCGSWCKNCALDQNTRTRGWMDGSCDRSVTMVTTLRTLVGDAPYA